MHSKEAAFSGQLVKLLNEAPRSHFRKTNDRAQVGMPDIVGCFEGIHVEIEVKHEAILNPKKKMPTGHYFTGPQMKELKHVHESGGVALGIIAAGNIGLVFKADLLGTDGRVILADHWIDVHQVILPNIGNLLWMIRNYWTKPEP